MVFETLHTSASSADAAAGVLCLLALANHKRKVDETDRAKNEDCIKRHKTNYSDRDATVKEHSHTWSTPYPTDSNESTPAVPLQTPDRLDQEVQTSQVLKSQLSPPSQYVLEKKTMGSRKKSSTDRISRLEQNRLAAKVSRERKKSMINELNRSITFFRETNLAIQKQNDKLESLVAQANSEVSNQNDRKQESKKKMQGSPSAPILIPNDVETTDTGCVGSTSAVPPVDLSSIQPGSTVQAMSNFQQAATQAMAAAMASLQSVPVFPNSDAPPSVINNSVPLPQYGPGASVGDISGIAFQAYMETLTAFAFQNSMLAAAAFANGQQQFQQPPSQAPLMNAAAPFMSGPFFALHQQCEQQHP